MSNFFRSIICIVLFTGLVFTAGCETMRSTKKTTNVLSLPKVEKAPEQASKGSVAEFIGRDRVNTMR